MRHARDQDLDRVEPLLIRLRTLDGMMEKKRGVFYRKSKSFLHFHEDPKGMFADIRNAAGDDFDRFNVTDLKGQDLFFAVTTSRL
jgi:hypothetical protein